MSPPPGLAVWHATTAADRTRTWARRGRPSIPVTGLAPVPSGARTSSESLTTSSTLTTEA